MKSLSWEHKAIEINEINQLPGRPPGDGGSKARKCPVPGSWSSSGAPGSSFLTVPVPHGPKSDLVGVVHPFPKMKSELKSLLV